MREVEVGVRPRAGIAPRAGVNADRAHECAELELTLRHLLIPHRRHSGMRLFGAGPESIRSNGGYAFRARAEGARPGMTILYSAQHVPMHPAAVEMEKRHRGVVPERAGGEALFQFSQHVFGHRM